MLQDCIHSHIEACVRLCVEGCDHFYAAILRAHDLTAGQNRVVNLRPGDDLGKPFTGLLEERIRRGVHIRIQFCGFPLNCVPNVTPADFVCQGRRYRQDVLPVVLILEESGKLIAESIVLLARDILHSAFAHVNIKPAHLFDQRNWCPFLDLFPGSLSVFAFDLGTDKVNGIDQSLRPDDSRRLLNYYGCREIHRTFFVKAYQFIDCSGIRIAPGATVDILQQLVDIIVSLSAVGILDCALDRFRVHIFFRLSAVEIVHPVKVLNGKHKRMIHTHVIDMLRPYLCKASQYNGIGGARISLFGEAGILQLHMTGRLVLLLQILIRRPQGEIVFFLEKLQVIQRHGYRVALLRQFGGKVALHLFHKTLLVLSQCSHDFRQDLRGQVIGIGCVDGVLNGNTQFSSLHNLRLTVIHKAAFLQMLKSLITAGQRIQAHDLFQIQLEFSSGGGFECVLLFQIPTIVAVFLHHVPVVIPCLCHIHCPNILALADVFIQLGKGIGANGSHGIDRLQKTPAKSFHASHRCDRFDMLSAYRLDLVLRVDRQLLHRLSAPFQEGLVGITNCLGHRLHRFVNLFQLFHGHVADRCFSDSFYQFLKNPGQNFIVSVLQHRIRLVLDLLVLRVKLGKSLTDLITGIADIVDPTGDVLNQFSLTGFHSLFQLRFQIPDAAFRVHRIHVDGIQDFRHSRLHTLRDVLVLALMQQKVLQLFHSLLNLVSQFSLLPALGSSLGCFPILFRRSLPFQLPFPFQ